MKKKKKEKYREPDFWREITIKKLKHDNIQLFGSLRIVKFRLFWC